MAMATATMDHAAERGASRPTRAVGLLAIATGVAGLVLLASHPEGNATTFAQVVQNEAADRAINAIVHGSFIGVLALQLVCYAMFTRVLGQRVSALAAFVFFAMGAAFMCASLLLDGLVTPAIAVRYVAKPDKIESARILFVLIGTIVSFLMPIGLLLQSAAIAAWGWALNANGSRVLGAIGMGLGGLLVLALGSSFVMMNPMVLMGALAATSVWAMMVGVLLMRTARE
jgi:hypothetical protein